MRTGAASDTYPVPAASTLGADLLVSTATSTTASAAITVAHRFNNPWLVMMSSTARQWRRERHKVLTSQ